jgi:hypothetical protein
MALNNELSASLPASRGQVGSGAWVFSLPLVAGLYVYLYFLFQGNELLWDGDTYSHIATGRWILENGVVPVADPFSHTMRGAPWIAFEWLSQVVLALVHRSGRWTGLVAVTSLSFAVTIALLTRALLRYFEPIHVVLFTGLAIAMTTGHVLARPHMLAMPLMMVWIIEMVRASESDRAPRMWLLPLMTLWANLHGSFTLGLAFACAFAFEALLAAGQRRRLGTAARAWGMFLVLALVASLLTPHGPRGLEVTWQVLFQDQYALERIGEWRSPNFHKPQPLELWLLGGIALALHQGIRVPPVRLALLLGLIHLSLKHIRYVELLGLLGPLVLALPLSAQWRQRQQTKTQFELGDRLFAKLAQPAGESALAASFAILVAAALWIASARPVTPSEQIAPVIAIRAAQQAGVKGPVLNGYEWGGYLIYSGIPSFIDGRSDMYRDAFIKDYVSALELHNSRGLENLLEKHKISWTLLPPQVSAVAMLDRLPGWRRLYEDKTAVVHIKVGP